MTFKEILGTTRLDDRQLDIMLDMLDEELRDPEKFKYRFSFIVNNGHHSEFTAMEKLACMVPVVYLDSSGSIMEAYGMYDYMSRRGITAEGAYSMVMSAYDRARSRASDKGMTAPPIDCNTWDAFVAIAYAFSDYWYTINGDSESVAMLAYEYLSDPDKKKTPVD